MKGRHGGNRKPQTFKDCLQCKETFGPLNRLSIKYCSRDCKHKAQTTGRKTIRKSFPHVRAAHSKIAYAIKMGRIARPLSCEDCNCNDKKIEAAHKDYSNPLDVRWLCRSCHVKWDKFSPKNGTYKATLEATGQTYSELKEVRNVPT